MKYALAMLGVASAFTVILAGCAGDRPDAPAAAALPTLAIWRTSVGRGDDASAKWWERFNDPQLTRVVEQALANNVDVALAASRVEEARARFRLARAQRFPDVNFALQGGREADVSPFGLQQYQTAGEGELLAVFDTDLFGRLAQANAAARAALLSSQASEANVRLAVAASSASAYLSLCEADGQLQILRDTLKARGESLKYAQSRSNSGYATALELKQAESEYHATEEMIPSTELAISQLEDGLSLLLGNPPQEIARHGDIQSITLPAVGVGVPSALLRRRPDVASAEQQLVAADHSLDSSRAAFMPELELTASGGFVASSIIPTPVKVFQLGGSILSPIFDSGRLRANEDVAIARRDAAAFEYRKVVLGAFREVDDALAAQDKLTEQEKAVIARRDSLAAALVFATNRYRAGYSSYLEQIDAERSLLSANLEVLQIHLQRLKIAVTLFEVSGGGYLFDAEHQSIRSLRQ
jgi:NodT family efflux transporter outer membrane factor (OMF) lipoprotein